MVQRSGLCIFRVSVPWPWIEPQAQQWKSRILTMRPPGNSWYFLTVKKKGVGSLLVETRLEWSGAFLLGLVWAEAPPPGASSQVFILLPFWPASSSSPSLDFDYKRNSYKWTLPALPLSGLSSLPRSHCYGSRWSLAWAPLQACPFIQPWIRWRLPLLALHAGLLCLLDTMAALLLPGTTPLQTHLQSPSVTPR